MVNPAVVIHVVDIGLFALRWAVNESTGCVRSALLPPGQYQSNNLDRVFSVLPDLCNET